MSESYTSWLHDEGDKNLSIEFYLNQLIKDISVKNPQSILFVPPDFTRVSSKTGFITSYLYHNLSSNIKKAVLPALGLHRPMSEHEKEKMFGAGWEKINFYEHAASIGDIQNSSSKKYPIQELGKLTPNEFLSYMNTTSANQGGSNKSLEAVRELIELIGDITVKVNKAILDFELVISLGQVVPHEVLGFANYHKNILIGVGGHDFISKSHFISAVLGISTILAQPSNPMRNLLKGIYEKYVTPKTNIYFIFTVTKKSNLTTQLIQDSKSLKDLPERSDTLNTALSENLDLQNTFKNIAGIFWGKGQEAFLAACALSEKENIREIKEPVDMVFVHMPREKYHSLWLTNKAIYRTLTILKPGGTLYIDAPGLSAYGENQEMNNLISQYGYMDIVRLGKILKDEFTSANQNKKQKLLSNLAVAGHLAHGYQDNHQVVFVDYSNVLDISIISESYNNKISCLNSLDYKRVGFESISYDKYFTKLSNVFSANTEKNITSRGLIDLFKNKSIQYQNKSYYFIYDAGLGFWKTKYE